MGVEEREIGRFLIVKRKILILWFLKIIYFSNEGMNNDGSGRWGFNKNK